MGRAVAAAAIRARHRQTAAVRAVIRSSPVASARHKAKKLNGSPAALIFPLTRHPCLKPSSKPTASKAPPFPQGGDFRHTFVVNATQAETRQAASLRF